MSSILQKVPVLPVTSQNIPPLFQRNDRLFQLLELFRVTTDDLLFSLIR